MKQQGPNSHRANGLAGLGEDMALRPFLSHPTASLLHAPAGPLSASCSLSTCCARRHARPAPCLLLMPGQGSELVLAAPAAQGVSTTDTLGHVCTHTPHSSRSCRPGRENRMVSLGGTQGTWGPHRCLVLVSLGSSGKRYKETSPFTGLEGK